MIRMIVFKTEIAPNKAQEDLLLRSCGVARWAWNWALGNRIAEYRENGSQSNAMDQSKQITLMKSTPEFAWLNEVCKDAVQYALRDLDRAYVNFYRRIKAGLGLKAGFPKFKAKGKATPSFSFQFCAVTETHIRVPRIGWIKLKEKGFIPTTFYQESGHMKIANGKLMRATIKQVASRWFISIKAELEVPEPVKREGAPIGVDLGLKTFAVLSDGTEIQNPKFYKKTLRKIKRLGRVLSRRKKGGKNREKARKRLAEAHYRVACRRRNFLHQESSKLVKTKPVLVFEDLNIKGMIQNPKLSQAIGDVGWGEFVRMCEYKAKWTGGTVIFANTFYPSSKTCSHCGWINRSQTLADRTFVCADCGLSIDRDLNGAKCLADYPSKHPDGFVPPNRREMTPVESVVFKMPQRSRNYSMRPVSGREGG